MWAEVNGERKKVACGPCIRGHRSSKCDHRDRVLVEVRKPGRPLSSCPHPTGSCSCERVIINYTIPKSSECACPSERAQPTATVAGNSRIQKNRRRSTAINTSSLEKAVQAEQDAKTDASSITRTPTERSGSIEASPLSSASSTPRLLPAQNGVSSCCKPKPVQPPVQQKSCCSSKVKEQPEPVQVKSCCSGQKAQANNIPHGQPNVYQQFGQQSQLQFTPQFQAPQWQSFHSQTSPPPPATLPFGLGAPIYNHAAAAYQQRTSIPMSPVMSGPIAPHNASRQVTQHVPEHNCHCGDSCSCFGCAAHPNNATMMEYVRLMAQFQYTGGFGAMPPPLYDMPTYPHHPGFGAEAFSPMSQGMTTPTLSNMSFHGSTDLSSLSSTPMVVSGPWQQPRLAPPTVTEPQFLEPSNYTASTPMEKQHLLKTEEPESSPIADSPSDSKDEDTQLSPSSYFWNQMVLPGCSDATGTCQCGDGCECVGCLTHGGHNGVTLEDSVTNEHDTFPNFTAEAGLTLDDRFMNFDPATT